MSDTDSHSEDNYDDNIVSKNVLYINSEYMTEKQVKEVLIKVITDLKLNKEVKFKINVVSVKDKLCKYGYIWINSEKICSILAGSKEYEKIKTYKNVMLLSTGILNAEQVKDAVSTLIIKTIPIIRKEGYIDTLSKACTVNIGDDGTSYISMESKELYNIIVGNNVDGTARVKYELIPDDTTDDWGAGEMKEQKLPSLVQLPKVRYSGEQLEFSDEKEVQLEILDYNCKLPKWCRRKEIIDETKFNIPTVSYTPEQIRSILIEEPSRKDFTHKLNFSTAYFKQPDPDFDPHVLVASNIPEWLTVGALRDEFYDYVSDKESKVLYKNKMISYPHIHITPKDKGRPRVYINFSPDSIDGIISNKMSRQLKVRNPKNQSQECVLYFNYNRKKKCEN
jgi:hypothetical protein